MFFKLIFLTSLVCLCHCTITEEDLLRQNPTWVAPDAVSRHRAAAKTKGAITGTAIEETPPSAVSAKSAQSSNVVTDIYFRQMVRMLFSRRKYTRDIVTGNLQRTISIKVTHEQLAKIFELVEDETRVADLSEEVIKVFEHLEEGFMEIVVDEIRSIGELVRMKVFSILRDPDLRFFVFAVLFIVIGYSISRFTKMNVYGVLLLMAFAVDFFTKYIECNAKKQVDEIIRFIELGNSNPCTRIDYTASDSVFSYIFRTKTSQEQACHAYMRSQTKVDIGFCKPLSFIGTYFGDIFIHANTYFITGLFDNYIELINGRGYFQGLLITLFFGIIGVNILKGILSTLLHAFFKYGLPGRSSHRSDEYRDRSRSEKHSGVEEIKEHFMRQNQQLVDHLLSRPLSQQQVPPQVTITEKLPEITEDTGIQEFQGSMTRRSSDTESIEVIPESLHGEESEEFEVIKEDHEEEDENDEQKKVK